MKPLSQKMIDSKFKQLSGWMLNKKKTELSKTFHVPDFVRGLAFVARIAVHAEVIGHHPIIEISYGKVVVTLTTDDVAGLTQLDFNLAKKIDSL